MSDVTRAESTVQGPQNLDNGSLDNGDLDKGHCLREPGQPEEPVVSMGEAAGTDVAKEPSCPGHVSPETTGAMAADWQGDVGADSAGDAGAVTPAVVAVAQAHLPADRGLSSLGLLMQLGGTLGIILASGLALPMVLLSSHDAAVCVFFLAVLGGVRAAFHRAAGSALLYRRDSKPLRNLVTYMAVAMCHSIVTLMFLADYGDSVFLAKAAALLLVWPMAVWVYALCPGVYALLQRGLPSGEDQGFAGAAVLMSVFGLIGAMCAAVILFYLLAAAKLLLFSANNDDIVLLVPGLALCGALLARSVIHSLAGGRYTSGLALDEHKQVTSRYYNLGILSAFVIGAGVFLTVLIPTNHMGMALFMGTLGLAVLWAWPGILRRLYLERDFDMYLAEGDRPRFERAPDAGLTALGWLLIATGGIALAWSVAEIVFSASETALGQVKQLEMVVGAFWSYTGLGSPWLTAMVSGLQLWAGIGLLRMGIRHQPVATIYGLVGATAALFGLEPMVGLIDALVDSTTQGTSFEFAAVIAVLGASVQLALAVGTIWLVNRTVLPKAIARIPGSPRRIYFSDWWR